MSILLDSLRKSEAQRKAGDTPTIYSTQEYGENGRSGKGWVLWALLGLSAAAIVWFGWQQYSFPGEQQVATQDQGDPANAPAQTAGTATPPRRAPEPRTRTPVEQLAQQATESPGAGDEGDAVTPAQRIAGFQAETPDAPPAEMPDSAPATSGESDAERALALMEAAAAEAQSEAIGETESEEFPGSEPVPDRPFRTRLSQTDPPENEPLSYWQLQQGLRNELPEFKITVLVYAEAPEDRFLLMNGERLREQDELERGVKLEEIRRDGAVFSYQSYRFLVKN